MEPRARKHVVEQRLEAYAMDVLAEDEVEIVEEHLLFCETCQKQLEAVEKYVLAMQGAAKRIREEERQAPATVGVWERIRGWFDSPLPIWAGAFAMLALIVMAGLHLRQPIGNPVEVELQAVRGPSIGTAPTGHPLNLKLDGRGVPEASLWRIEIVDENGAKVWMGSGEGSGNVIMAKVERSFAPGIYFVRLVKEGEDPIREYQLTVTAAGP